MHVNHIHDWDLNYKEARKLQDELSGKIEEKPIGSEPELIGGLDCAFTKDKKKVIACTVILKFPEMELVEKKHAFGPVKMPYIPGLLSFREAPVCLEALEKIENVPDVFIIDGQGTAHPRKLGLASHIGLFIKVPTIGCAKSRLIGEFEEPGVKKGEFTDLKYKDELVGAVVRTRTDVKPLFISPGNRCNLSDSVNIVLKSAIKYRLPEPSRIAHHEVTKLRYEVI